MGSGGHLAGALFLQLAGVSALHVPYKSAGASILSVVQNESQWTFTPIGAPLPHVRAGKLRALAVRQRHSRAERPGVASYRGRKAAVGPRRRAASRQQDCSPPPRAVRWAGKAA